MDNKEMIDKIFTRLDLWRNFPNYQLERRADIFFSLYIEDIIKAKYGATIDHVIPEFPVRIGHISPKDIRRSNFSNKIDYLAVSESDAKVYFIELKTDQASRNTKQDVVLLRAKEVNIKGLINGVIELSHATKEDAKYSHLVHALCSFGWLDNTRANPQNTSKDYDITIVYIQPTNPDNIEDVISFEDIISYLSDRKDDFTERFLKSLVFWQSRVYGRSKPTLFTK